MIFYPSTCFCASKSTENVVTPFFDSILQGGALKKLIIITYFALSTIGCGDIFNFNSSVDPIVDPAPLSESDQVIELNVESEIASTKIEPTLIRKIVQITFGWIPLVGDIIELPLNLASALLPKLSALEIINLPDDASVNDPDLQNVIQFIQLDKIFLMITPEELIPEEDRKEKCFIFFECREPNLDFIKEIRVYIAQKGEKEKGALIAQSNNEIKISNQKRSIELEITENFNLKPYLMNIENYEVRTLVRGRPPKRTLYLQGGVSLNIKLGLNLE